MSKLNQNFSKQVNFKLHYDFFWYNDELRQRQFYHMFIILPQRDYLKSAPDELAEGSEGYEGKKKQRSVFLHPPKGFHDFPTKLPNNLQQQGFSWVFS
jgi:hypothetical protein